MQKEFPEDQEITTFVATFAPLLAGAMRLRTLRLRDRQFYTEARKTKQAIIDAAEHPARHPGIQRIQDIFRQKAHRLYHWAGDRKVPAENTFAERDLRGLVIARKVSFGSQSDAGPRTREVLMTALLTLKKRYPDFQARFKTPSTEPPRVPASTPTTSCSDQIPSNPPNTE